MTHNSGAAEFVMGRLVELLADDAFVLELLFPSVQQRVVDVEVAGDLGDGETLFDDFLDGRELELTRKRPTIFHG